MLGGRLAAVEADVARRQQHHRHGVVDQRHVDAVDRLAPLAGGEQRAGLAARRIEEAELDLGAAVPLTPSIAVSPS